MPFLKQLVLILRLIVTPRTEIILGNIALRQQLCVLSRQRKRPRLRSVDRAFWVWLSRIWAGWRGPLLIVRPETVIRWHRQGWRLYWRWKSRRKTGRPAIGVELCGMIRRMPRENPT